MTGSAPGMASSSSAAGGTDTAMALNVPSTLPSLSTLRNALTRSSPTPPEDWQADVTSPAADAAALYSRSSSFFSRRCPDSQRLNGSESCANRKSSCSSPWPSTVSLTGAEKPRSTDSVGGSVTPVNTNCWLSFSRRSTMVVGPDESVPPTSVSGMSFPSAPSRPTASGMRHGSLTVWPGDGGLLCFAFSVSVWLAALYSASTLTRGVPAMLYHGFMASRSASLASAMAARKSSQVTA
mmetsp:Transcript_972/g.2606  ORF Transcript_972/g.2606 Transcript_972/m.2606 type:complete len:238 (+) Transcript_972:899-1612(+)